MLTLLLIYRTMSLLDSLVGTLVLRTADHEIFTAHIETASSESDVTFRETGRCPVGAHFVTTMRIPVKAEN